PSFATKELKLIEMLQRYQGPSEPVMQYYTEKMAMIHKLGMHFSESEICRFLVLGLNPDIIANLIMNEGATSNLVNLEKALISLANAKYMTEYQAMRHRSVIASESNVMSTNSVVTHTSPLTHPPIPPSVNNYCCQISEVPADNYGHNTNFVSRNKRRRDVNRKTKARRVRAKNARNSYCYVCGKEDHTARYCNHRFHATNATPEQEKSESIESRVNYYYDNNNRKHFVSYIKGTIGILDMSILLDTGAGRSVISRETMLSLDLPFEKNDSNLKLYSASGHKLEIAGKAFIPCKIEGVEFIVEFLVINNLKTVLLIGMNTLRDLSATIKIGQGTCTLEKNGITVETQLALSPENKDIAYLSGTYEVVDVNKKEHNKQVRFSEQVETKFIDKSDILLQPPLENKHDNSIPECLSEVDPNPLVIPDMSQMEVSVQHTENTSTPKLINSRAIDSYQQPTVAQSSSTFANKDADTSSWLSSIASTSYGINNVSAENSDSSPARAASAPLGGIVANTDTLEKTKVDIINEVSVRAKIEATCQINKNLDNDTKENLLKILYRYRETFDVFYSKKIAGNAKLPPVRLECNWQRE
ncbi:hypothetical protein WDU94_012347, partial [Cyamophila willieti]